MRSWANGYIIFTFSNLVEIIYYKSTLVLTKYLNKIIKGKLWNSLTFKVLELWVFPRKIFTSTLCFMYIPRCNGSKLSTMQCLGDNCWPGLPSLPSLYRPNRGSVHHTVRHKERSREIFLASWSKGPCFLLLDHLDRANLRLIPPTLFSVLTKQRAQQLSHWP